MFLGFVYLIIPWFLEMLDDDIRYYFFVLYTAYYGVSMFFELYIDNPLLRRLPFWRVFQLYFGGMEVHLEEDLPPRALVLSFPHGMMSSTTIFRHMLHGRKERHVDACTASKYFFMVPFLRDIAVAFGAVPHRDNTILKLLNDNKRVLVSPEGVMGVVAGQRKKLDMHLGDNCRDHRRQDGIMHYAFKHDIPVVMAFNHNEDRVGYGMSAMTSIQRKIVRNFGLCLPCTFWGPFPVPITIYMSRVVYPSAYKTVEEFKCELYRILAKQIDAHTTREDRTKNMNRWVEEQLTS